MKHWRSFITSMLVLLAGTCSLWAGTDGWKVWTAESARRLAVRNTPVPLPALRLKNENNRTVSLDTFDKPLILIDFIFTGCTSVCIAMGAEFRYLQNHLAALGLIDQVQLLSLTFDQQRDGPAQLADYLRRFSADPNHWSAARFESERQLRFTLQQLGVVVIPEPEVGFVHNAAVYLVREGAVMGIYDFNDRSGLLEAVRWHLTH